MVARDKICVLGDSPFHDMVRMHGMACMRCGASLGRRSAEAAACLPASTMRIHAHACMHCHLRQDLTCSGRLSYLGTSWRKDVAFAGYGVPLQVRRASRRSVIAGQRQHA